MEICYEAIQADPEAALKKLFDFCQIPYTPQSLAQPFEDARFCSRLQPREDDFRRGGRMDDWRSRFSLIDRLIFDRAAGDLLIELDDEPDRRWIWCGF